jgi:hypothetical protein
VHGKRLILSVFRTFSPVKSVKIQLAIAGQALAVAAAMAGILGTAGPAAVTGTGRHSGTRTVAAASSAGPIGSARQIQFSATSAVLAPAVTPATGAHPGGPPQLDAFIVDKAGRPVALTPRQIARRMLGRFHWAAWQFRYLNLLWTHESGWNVYASNGYTGAYGIPQAVPGAKMASAGPRWWSSASTQIRWGLRYIKQLYGSPWAAWQHELSTGWY